MSCCEQFFKNLHKQAKYEKYINVKWFVRDDHKIFGANNRSLSASKIEQKLLETQK